MRDQHVYLNGISLEDAHPLILLQHISENAPELDVKTADRAGAAGGFLTGLKPTKREITVEFAVRERLDFTRRAEAVSAAMAWAMNGGWLSLSSRPGLRIHVNPAQLPAVGKLREWTENSTILFEANEWPLWTDLTPARAELTAGTTAASAYLSAAGTWPTGLEADITPSSAALTSVSISACGKTMTVSGISVAAESTLKIWWDEHHLLRITAGATGLLNKRTGDDLILPPGRHEVSVTANTACDVTLMARGCYL